MSYIPSIEKLRGLGFWPVAPVYTGETRYWKYKDAIDAPGLEWIVSIYPDAQIHLLEAGGWVSKEGGDPVFIGHCPSEEFFDQLIIAVDWPSAPLLNH